MLNRVTLVGHVGKDPDVRHLDNGVSVARFSLATNETYTDKSGERKTTTEWHNIVVWRGLADVAEKYVKSGSLLYVEGKLKTSSYDDKDGVKHYRTDIICDNFRMLGKKDSTTQDAPKESTQESSTVQDPTDDLPF